jgi:hypothetical protein
MGGALMGSCQHDAADVLAGVTSRAREHVVGLKIQYRRG